MEPAGRRALASPGQQHARLGNEPRLDEPLSPGDWDRRKYPFPHHRTRKAHDEELARWCRRELDRQTDETGEARYRKAARPPEQISLETVTGYDRYRREITADDRAALERWQRERREEEEPPRRFEDWREFWWWESLSEDEQFTIRLLAGERVDGDGLPPHGRHTLPSNSQADYLPRGRTGRMVDRMLGVTETTIRNRRETAARKLDEAGVSYVTRGPEPDRGPEWCARRPAPRLGCAPHTIHREAVAGAQSSLAA